MNSIELVAFDESLPLARRMVAARTLLRVEKFKRKYSLTGIQTKENIMDERIRIMVDCTGEMPHSLSVGNQSCQYDELEDLADDLDVLLEAESYKQAA